MSGEKKSTSVVVRKVKQDNSVNELISQAITANVSVETMEKLFALRSKVKEERAKEAFVTAMANFQSECPVIEKTKKVLNKDGQSVRYKFAPIDSIVSQIQKPLSKNGLSYSWDVKNETGFITAIVTITHEFGHSQTSEFKVPIDTEGYMSAPQKYASALTFAKRYSLCNALGISTGDEDTDATDVGKEAEAKSKKAKIVFQLKSLGHSPKTKEETVRIIQTLTQLEADDSNYDEIVTRLGILVSEKQAHDKSNI